MGLDDLSDEKKCCIKVCGFLASDLLVLGWAVGDLETFGTNLDYGFWWFGNSNILLFLPTLGKFINLPVAYFSNGLVQPPTRLEIFCDPYGSQLDIVKGLQVLQTGVTKDS